MKEPHWIEPLALRLLHSASLAEHGGKEGVRDEGLLESALSRPRNKFHYDPDCTILDLAAAYGFGLAQNHPFYDGNKRAAFLAVGLFLGRNGYKLIVSQISAAQIMFELASGQMRESEFVEWIRKNAHRTPPTE